MDVETANHQVNLFGRQGHEFRLARVDAFYPLGERKAGVSAYSQQHVDQGVTVGSGQVDPFDQTPKR